MAKLASLWVDKVRKQVLIYKRGTREIKARYAYRRETKWIRDLWRLGNGEILTNLSPSSLRWIRRFLSVVNREQGTFFRLGQRRLRGGPHIETVLCGG